MTFNLLIFVVCNLYCFKSERGVVVCGEGVFVRPMGEGRARMGFSEHFLFLTRMNRIELTFRFPELTLTNLTTITRVF